MAEDVVVLLDRLGVERAHVIGWSMGGTIGLHLAVGHPERVGKLVLQGTPYHRDGLDDGFREWFRAAAPGDWSHEAIDFYKANAPDPGHWDVFFGKLRDMVMTEPTFTEADLARVRAPTLVVYGREKTVIRPAHMEAMARAILVAKTRGDRRDRSPRVQGAARRVQQGCHGIPGAVGCKPCTLV